MSYQRSTRGVIDLTSGETLTPGSPGWATYETWLSAGGTPRPPPPTPRWPDLAAARADLCAHVCIERARREAGGFAFRGKVIDSDDRARVRLMSAIVAATIATVRATAFTRTWTTADGSPLALDAVGMLALAQAMADYDNACAARATALKTAIAAADIATLETLDINEGWPT